MAYYDPSTGILQGGTGTAKSTQGSSPAALSASTGGLAVQGSPSAAATLQRGAIAPGYNQTLPGAGARNTALVSPAAAAPVDQLPLPRLLLKLLKTLHRLKLFADR
jgi:hypothetical protein